MKLKTIRNIFLSSAILLIVFGVGYRFGSQASTGFTAPVLRSSQVTGKDSAASSAIDFSQFWEVWDSVSKNYIDKKAIDPAKMVNGAISGMVSSLGDPYTVFLPPTENKEAKDDLGGKFEGIGAQLGVKDKKIVVIAPLKGSPAEKAHLLPGDWIQKVGDKDTAELTLPEVVSQIRGPKGTSVTLLVLTKDATKPAEVKVVRDSIEVASVEWEMKNVECSGSSGCQIRDASCTNCSKVVYLKLTRFGDQTYTEWEKAIDEIDQAIQKFPKQQVKGLVFDLRNNPGGYLTGSVFIGSEFLKDGTVVIQEASDGSRENQTVNREGKLTDIPMTVLVNKGSASAAEIVAGALQARSRAKIVGETSFGKGTIQQAFDLKNGAGLHITMAKWLLPNGVWINGSGLTPDVKVELDANKPDVDIQLEKAIDTLVQ